MISETCAARTSDLVAARIAANISAGAQLSASTTTTVPTELPPIRLATAMNAVAAAA